MVRRNEFVYPSKIYPIFDNTEDKYIVIYGGRAKGGSWSIAQEILQRGMYKKLRILCTREIQRSIHDSVHILLCDTIERKGLGYFYEIQKNCILGKNGTLIFYEGLHRNLTKIKSYEGIDICYIEEAESITQESLDILIPTIMRKENAQIIVLFNPKNEEDPCYQEFVKKARPNSLLIKTNYIDNEFCPNITKMEAEYCKKTDYDKYRHVWLGEFKLVSDALIFKGKYRIDSFNTPEDISFYYGSDFGFSNDPTTLIRCYIQNNRLWIDHEAWGLGVDIDYLPILFNAVPDSRKWNIRGDSSRPETISYLNRNGYNVNPTRKGKGSIEDGISFIRSFEEIIIHSRCKHTIDEFNHYSYKVDKLTNKPTPVPEDRDNHCIDALRYALEDVNREPGIFVLS